MEIRWENENWDDEEEVGKRGGIEKREEVERERKSWRSA